MKSRDHTHVLDHLGVHGNYLARVALLGSAALGIGNPLETERGTRAPAPSLALAHPQGFRDAFADHLSFPFGERRRDWREQLPEGLRRVQRPVADVRYHAALRPVL